MLSSSPAKEAGKRRKRVPRRDFRAAPVHGPNEERSILPGRLFGERALLATTQPEEGLPCGLVGLQPPLPPGGVVLAWPSGFSRTPHGCRAAPPGKEPAELATLGSPAGEATAQTGSSEAASALVGCPAALGGARAAATPAPPPLGAAEEEEEEEEAAAAAFARSSSGGSARLERLLLGRGPLLLGRRESVEGVDFKQLGRPQGEFLQIPLQPLLSRNSACVFLPKTGISFSSFPGSSCRRPLPQIRNPCCLPPQHFLE